MAKRLQHRTLQHVKKLVFFCAKLGSSWAQNPLRTYLNFWLRFGSCFGASRARFCPDFGAVLGSNFGPRRASNLKRPRCTKWYYLQYETIVFAIPRGLKIDEKSMPKRLQDKIGFQDSKCCQHRPKLGPKIEPSCIINRSKKSLHLKGCKNEAPTKWRPRVLASQGLRPKAT